MYDIKDILTECCRDAGGVFLLIEIGLFVFIGLLMPLGVIFFSAPGALGNKVISILFLGIPYLFTPFAPYATWFWLSAVAIFGLFFLIATGEEGMSYTLTSGARVMAGIGVIIAFVLLDALLANVFLSMQGDPSSGIVHIMRNVTGM